MKTNLLIMTLFFTKGIFAAPMFCEGGKWNVDVNNNLTQATLTYNNQPVEFGDLNCEGLKPQSGPDQGKYLLSCTPAQAVADAGYHVVIYLDLPGIDMKGRLNEISLLGSKKITDLKCIGAAN